MKARHAKKTGNITEYQNELELRLKAALIRHRDEMQLMTENRDRFAKLLAILAERHRWHPELGECVCEAHKQAADLLAELANRAAERK